MREGIRQKLGLTDAELEDLGRRWNTLELSLFGSALRDDFKPDSDVDMLVKYEPPRGVDCKTISEWNRNWLDSLEKR